MLFSIPCKNYFSYVGKMTSYVRDFWTYTSHQRPTVGDVKMSVVTTDHMGWLLCDGRELSKFEYNILYQIIGDAYGSTATTFNLPRTAGRVLGNVNTPSVSGYDISRNTWNRGDVSGTETHTLTIAQMPSHNHGTNASNTVVGNGLTGVSGEHIHGITDPGHTHSYVQSNNSNSQVSGSLIGPTVNDDVFNSTTDSSVTGITINPAGAHQHTIATQGGDQPHNNIQPTIIIGNTFMYCGKPRQGTYPTSVVNYFYF